MIKDLFDLPLMVIGPAIILSMVLFGVAGLFVNRRIVLPYVTIRIQDSEFTGAIAQSVMVFYGLAAGLIAVNVFQTYSEVERITSREATALAALYRDVSNYPEPVRGKLQEGLRVYTDQVINEAFPQMHQGIVPRGGVELMNTFQADLAAFEPVTEGQKILHDETFSAYNRMIEARRARVDAVKTELPAVMWIVILLGAVTGIGAAYFFEVADVRLHALLVALLSFFIGLIIFMIFAFDRPFRGDRGIGSEPYQLVYDQLMKK